MSSALLGQCAMFGEVTEAHKRREALLRRQRDARREKAVYAVENLAENLLDRANEGVGEIYARQWDIENQIKALTRETHRLERQTENWIEMFKKFNESLKEIGDVGSWATAIERDLKQVVQTLEDVQAVLGAEQSNEMKSESK